MRKGYFVASGLFLRHIASEVNDPHAANPARDVETVYPRTNDSYIRSPGRIRLGEQVPCFLPLHIELPALRVPHEGDVSVLHQRGRFAGVDIARE